MDIKPLPYYWLQMTRLRLPRQLYDVRDVKSGAVFADYGNDLLATYAALSATHPAASGL
jgi:hypothetical protein